MKALLVLIALLGLVIGHGCALSKPHSQTIQYTGLYYVDGVLNKYGCFEAELLTGEMSSWPGLYEGIILHPRYIGKDLPCKSEGRFPKDAYYSISTKDGWNILARAWTWRDGGNIVMLSRPRDGAYIEGMFNNAGYP